MFTFYFQLVTIRTYRVLLGARTYKRLVQYSYYTLLTLLGIEFIYTERKISLLPVWPPGHSRCGKRPKRAASRKTHTVYLKPQLHAHHRTFPLRKEKKKKKEKKRTTLTAVHDSLHRQKRRLFLSMDLLRPPQAHP